MPATTRHPPRIESPTPGLHLALDPRIPDELEAFAFRLDAASETSRIEWLVDGTVAAVTERPVYPWPVQRGLHSMRARVWPTAGSEPVETQTVRFLVK